MVARIWECVIEKVGTVSTNVPVKEYGVSVVIK